MNAAVAVSASGGSTNAVLHLMAIAAEAGVDFPLDAFDQACATTPVIADLQPGGRYLANDLFLAGGTRLLAKRLADAGRLTDAPTVTGRTLCEEAADAVETEGQQVIHPIDDPGRVARRLRHPLRQPRTRGLRRQAVGPRAGRASPARRPCSMARRRRSRRSSPVRIGEGEVVVIRYEGPRGGPGMREMLAVTAALKGRGLREGRADHRRALLRRQSHGFVIGHVAPEAAVGGPIALIRDDDVVTIDVAARRLTVAADLDARRAGWRPRPVPAHPGALTKYARLVSSASKGAITIQRGADPMKIHTNDDVPADALEGERVAVIGYGSQGRAHAHEPGTTAAWTVVVGARAGGRGAGMATDDGLTIMEPADAVRQATFVSILTPDMSHAALYRDVIEPNLAEGAALLFAHGFSILYDRVTPAPRHRRHPGRPQGSGGPGAARVRARARRALPVRGRAGRHRPGARAGARLCARHRRHHRRGDRDHLPRGDRDRPVRRAGGACAAGRPSW